MTQPSSVTPQRRGATFAADRLEGGAPSFARFYGVGFHVMPPREQASGQNDS